jgi:hypothetical protein
MADSGLCRNDWKLPTYYYLGLPIAVPQIILQIINYLISTDPRFRKAGETWLYKTVGGTTAWMQEVE